MEAALQDILTQGAEQFGVKLNTETQACFGVLMDELIEANKVMNLTAITEPREIVVKHFLDSLSLFASLPLQKGGRLIDVGCGAGFPGLPLLLTAPGLTVTFLDGQEKRLRFIDDVCKKFGLSGSRYTCLHARAEEAGRLAAHREHYDFATARAVAALPVLAEYCMPLVKPGGFFAAMKGPAAEAERESASKALRVLGGREQSAKEFTLPFSQDARTVIVIEKLAATPGQYPRTQAKIKKAPL